VKSTVRYISKLSSAVMVVLMMTSIVRMPSNLVTTVRVDIEVVGPVGGGIGTMIVGSTFIVG